MHEFSVLNDPSCVYSNAHGLLGKRTLGKVLLLGDGICLVGK